MMESMETDGLKQEAYGSITVESTERTTNISIKCERENGPTLNLDIFPTVPVPVPADVVIKEENFNESYSPIFSDLDLIQATTLDNSNTKDPNTTDTLGTILKTETGIVLDDYNCSNDSCSCGSDSNSEPEIYPFADVKCSLTVFQKPDQNPSSNSNSSGTQVQLLHPNPTGAFNGNDSSDPSSSFANTSTHKRQCKQVDTNLKCQLCLETQSSKGSLKTHEKICAESLKNRLQLYELSVAKSKESSSDDEMDQKATAVKVQEAKYKSPKKVCAICQTSYANNRNLKIHVERDHKVPFIVKETKVGDKNRKCKTCSKAYADYSNLRNHIRKKHPRSLQLKRKRAKSKQTPVVCAICSRTYSYRSNCTRHMKSHHIKREPS